MIREFSDFHPVFSGVIIFLLFTLVPGAFLLLIGPLLVGAVNGERIVLFYALALQLLICRNVERPALVMIPFISILAGFIISDVYYVISMGLRPPGTGPSIRAYLITTAIVSVFGSELGGVVGGLLISGALSLVRALRN